MNKAAQYISTNFWKKNIPQTLYWVKCLEIWLYENGKTCKKYRRRTSRKIDFDWSANVRILLVQNLFTKKYIVTRSMDLLMILYQMMLTINSLTNNVTSLKQSGFNSMCFK